MSVIVKLWSWVVLRLRQATSFFPMKKWSKIRKWSKRRKIGYGRKMVNRTNEEIVEILCLKLDRKIENQNCSINNLNNLSNSKRLFSISIKSIFCWTSYRSTNFPGPRHTTSLSSEKQRRNKIMKCRNLKSNITQKQEGNFNRNYLQTIFNKLLSF